MIYAVCFYIVSEMNTGANSTSVSVILWEKNGRKSFAAGGSGGLNLAICGANNYLK